MNFSNKPDNPKLKITAWKYNKKAGSIYFCWNLITSFFIKEKNIFCNKIATIEKKSLCNKFVTDEKAP